MMKKSKGHSEVSMKSSVSSARFDKEIKEIVVPPMDILVVKVLSLRLPSEDLKHYAIKVTFFDQLLLSGIIVPIDAREMTKENTQMTGTFNYDPSDYEKMCLFANNPLVVAIQPLKNLGTPYFIGCNSPVISDTLMSSKTNSSNENANDDTTSCCNVDILPIFIDKDKLCVRKRMQPMKKPTILNMKSWDNLPLLTMELNAKRNPENTKHHSVLKAANFMKVTIVAAYNMLIPYDFGLGYTAASKTPLSNDKHAGIVTYSQGCNEPNRFDPLNLYPKWESLRLTDNEFTDGDTKLVYDIDQLQNESHIDLNNFLYKSSIYTTVWGSFHRTLMLENSDVLLFKHLRRYSWPVEVHIRGDRCGYSFMTCLDLFRLLYPGENKLCLAVPLYWIDPDLMLNKCNSELLLPPFEKAPSTSTGQKRSKDAPDSYATSSKSDMYYERPTGADGTNAFLIVEVELGHPLKKPVIPPQISNLEIQNMLQDMEQGPNKKKCTGRGQLDKEWQTTIRAAASLLKKVPQYGMTEFCAFQRQLSETRTRVELSTSFWQDAAIYVNNNFTIHNYLQSDEMFEEMLMMSHACLMKIACDTLVGVEDSHELHPVMKAARHARHMQDIIHAKDLYLQAVAEKGCDANAWRELGTCLKDYDLDWAAACVDVAMELNPRHALTILSKGCMVFENDPEAAEPFFIALLSLHPFWSIGWIITSTYYLSRNYFNMADQVLEHMKRTKAEGLADNFGYPRSWERELGDWWDHTPLLPGMNQYYDAADLLLRLRAMSLAEICIARSLSESGESAAYVHLLSLCCRLRGQVDNALCHMQKGLRKFGDISYLRSLEAECLHKKKECATAITSLEKAGTCIGPFSTLLSLPIREPPRARSVLVDLIRRHPSAYAWMALADDWMMRSASGQGGDGTLTEEQSAALACAAACAVQALKWDWRAGRAWALLARLLRPRARQDYCKNMAIACGYIWPDEGTDEEDSVQSICITLGIPLLECQCKCEHMNI